MLITIIDIINWIILWYLIIFSAGYIFLLIVSIPDIIFHFKEVEFEKLMPLTDSKTLPPVTIIVPAYNEEKSILEALYSIIKSNYPNLFIIVVNDGSSDNTLQILIETFKLHKINLTIPSIINIKGKIKNCYLSEFQINLIMVDKEHTGKSDSLNTALNLCRTPLFITFDADSFIDSNAINEIVLTLLMTPNTIAVGGAVYILNGCNYKDGEMIEAKFSNHPLLALQAIEYLRSFLFSRSGWNFLGGALCYSGTFTLFELREVLKIKGFDYGNCSQDFEIITHLHSHKLKHNIIYNISYTPAATSWTEVPTTLKDYWVQHGKWQIGILDSLFKHMHMLFNPYYRIIGLYTYPFYLFGEAFGPVVEFIAYLSIVISWCLGMLNIIWFLLFLILCWGLVTFITMVTAFLSYITFNKYIKLNDLLKIFFWVTLESFGFRQYVVACRVVATFRYFIGDFKSKLS